MQYFCIKLTSGHSPQQRRKKIFILTSMYSNNIKNRIRSVGMLFLALFLTGTVSSCKDDSADSDSYKPFDPNLPVMVQAISPESGSGYEQIIIYGSNFGTNKENVSLKIGGQQAVVVSVMSDKLYGFIPPRAFSGEIELTIYDDAGQAHTGTSQVKLNYERQPVVSTLCGYQNDNDTQGELWGSFDVCTGFNYEGCLAVDPLNPDKVYIVYDRNDNGFVAELDLAKREASRLMQASKFQNQRLRNAAFTNDGQYMLISADQGSDRHEAPSVWIVKRNPDGTFNNNSDAQVLAKWQQCNGVAVHPVNGEVYFNSYEDGQLFRLELDDYFKAMEIDETTGEAKGWTGDKADGCFRELFQIMDPRYEFQIVIHPSGNYAYLVVINRNYILRTDYNWQKKEFMTPYVVAGFNSDIDRGEWVDAVGSNARFKRPYQGIFVKNPQYEAEGKDDVYDFYINDCLNFCVRYMTPEGIVRTYAGRAPSTNGNIWGTEDGGLRTAARFRDVTGLAYDEKRERFYVLDHNNRRIRTIGQESEDMIIVDGDDEEEGEEGDNENSQATE